MGEKGSSEFEPSSDLLRCRFNSKCRPVNPTTETTKQLRQRLEKVYASGRPLFTKKNIRYTWAQTKRAVSHGGKVYSKDFSGNTIEHDVMFGRNVSIPEHVCTDCENHQYTIWSDLSLWYLSKENLKANLKMKNGDAILSPVSIVHRGYLLDVDTDEPLPADEVVDHGPVSLVYRAKSYEWKSTSICRKLKAILSASAHSHDINKVIGFGLGGFSRRMIPYKSATRAMTQHVLLRVLKDWLQKKTGGKSPCYAQDPAYNSTDTQVLQENGIEVIDDPCGWLEVDEQSMVVSIAATVPVKEIIADIARPAVIIWDRVSFEDAIGMTGESARLDPNSYRVFKMMEEYDMFEFGAGEDLCPWGSIVVYIRKSKTAVPPNFK